MVEKTPGRRDLPCPRCMSMLGPSTYLGLPVDSCAACRGVWLDHGEFKRLLENRRRDFTEDELKRIAELRAKSRAPEADPRAACPVCAREMERFNYPQTKITLDRCAGHGTWLDEGELERVQIAVERLMKTPRPAGTPRAIEIAPPRTQSWTCPKCGERLESQFTGCWKCAGRARGTEVVRADRVLTAGQTGDDAVDGVVIGLGVLEFIGGVLVDIL